MLSLLCVLVFPYLFGPRSLAGGEQGSAEAEVPEPGQTQGEGEVKEVEMQEQRVDEEVQSIKSFEGRKVRWKNPYLRFNEMFAFSLCTYLTECG